MDHQAIRITEALEDYFLNPAEYSFQDFEDIFEDRDPVEFL